LLSCSANVLQDQFLSASVLVLEIVVLIVAVAYIGADVIVW